MRKLLILGLILIPFYKGTSQCDDSYSLFDQVAVDSFSSTYGWCDTVNTLVISPNDGVIDNLRALEHLVNITRLRIFLNDDFTAIGDLQSLSAVGSLSFNYSASEADPIFPNLKMVGGLGIHKQANFAPFERLDHINYSLNLYDYATYDGWKGYTSGDTVRVSFEDMMYPLDIALSMEWADGKHMDWFRVDGADTLYDTGSYTIPTCTNFSIWDVRYFDAKNICNALRQTDEIRISFVGDMDFGDGFIHVDSLEDRLVLFGNQFDIRADYHYPALEYVYDQINISENKGAVELFEEPIMMSSSIPRTWQGDLIPKVVIADNPQLTDCTSGFWCHIVQTLPDSLVRIENNGPGCSYDEIVAACTVSTTAMTAIDDIRIWPSPVADYLYVRGVAAETEYQMVSMQGQVMQAATVGTGRIDIAPYPSGIYILRLQLDDAVHSERIVVE